MAEDPDTTRANETVGFVGIEAGHGTIGGVEVEAALGADTVRGPDNSPPYTYSFVTAFASAPAVAVVTMAAMDGLDVMDGMDRKATSIESMSSMKSISGASRLPV